MIRPCCTASAVTRGSCWMPSPSSARLLTSRLGARLALHFGRLQQADVFAARQLGLGVRRGRGQVLHLKLSVAAVFQQAVRRADIAPLTVRSAYPLSSSCSRQASSVPRPMRLPSGSAWYSRLRSAGKWKVSQTSRPCRSFSAQKAVHQRLVQAYRRRSLLHPGDPCIFDLVFRPCLHRFAPLSLNKINISLPPKGLLPRRQA